MNTSRPRQALSRDQVLVAYAAEMIARSSLSQDDFAQALSLQLYRLVPEKAAAKDVPDFEVLARGNDTAAFLRASGNWLRRVGRWLCGEVDLPCWLEEAWVYALEGEYQERCLNELASRYGMTGARELSNAGAGLGAFGQFVANLGRAVEVGSEVMADGRISADDLPLLPAFVDRLLAVEARCCELRSLAEAVRCGAGADGRGRSTTR